MCDHAGVGKLADGKPQGCFVGPDGQALPEERTSNEMGLLIPTLEGLMLARQNDWVIRGVSGELYPCKPDIFEKTYERCHNPHCVGPHASPDTECVNLSRGALGLAAEPPKGGA